MEHQQAERQKEEIRSTHRELRRLEKALAQARAEAQTFRAQYQEVIESRSWLMTGPLRWCMSALRRTVSIQQEAAGPDQAGPIAEGVESLPEFMQIPIADDLDSANAPCRRLSMSASPPLESVISERARSLLVDESGDMSDTYLGWCGSPEKIAFIGSHELRCELAFEAHVSEVPDQDWKTVLAPGRHRFLLVETVWQTASGHWRYGLVRDGGSREHFQALLSHCRSISLPVVVWFRQGTSNYEQFAWLAEACDRIYAVDDEIGARLRQDFPQLDIATLAPGIQPALHNPLRSYSLMDAADALGNRIMFDGWWDLLAGAGEDPELCSLKQHGLLVAESEWEFAAVRLADSEKFRDHTVGCLGREEKLAANRLFGAEVFVRKPLAGAWRSEAAMLRAAASGSLVSYLDGSPVKLPELDLPPGEGAQVSRLPSLLADPVARAARAHLAWRRLASEHTLAHRLQRIADDLDLPCTFLPESGRIACLLVTMRPELLQSCLECFRRDVYPHKELVIVVNRDDCSASDFAGLIGAGEAIRLFVAGSSRSLGACLNFAAAQTDAPFWTKIDDDDLYGPNYLSDIMLYQRARPFKVFGKPPVFGYLESGDDLRWDFEWARHANLVHDAVRARAALVAGGTIGGAREVLDALPFSERRRGGSDSDFLRRCYDYGFDVLAADAFNFVRFRSSRQGFHTWQLVDEDVRQRSIAVGTARDIGRVAFI